MVSGSQLIHYCPCPCFLQLIWHWTHWLEHGFKLWEARPLYLRFIGGNQWGCHSWVSCLWGHEVNCLHCCRSHAILKTSYLTLSSAKSMFVSQVFGMAMGCLIAPLTFWLFWTAFDIRSPDGPYKAPYAVIFREMAILGVEGFSELPKHCLAICCGFFVAAIVTNFLRDVTPTKFSQFIPLPMAMTIPFYFGAYLQ